MLTGAGVAKLIVTLVLYVNVAYVMTEVIKKNRGD